MEDRVQRETTITNSGPFSEERLGPERRQSAEL
jgi:hypothetical protein